MGNTALKGTNIVAQVVLAHGVVGTFACHKEVLIVLAGLFIKFFGQLQRTNVVALTGTVAMAGVEAAQHGVAQLIV